MLPVACLPVASILFGIGYWIDSDGWGANNLFAAFLITAGLAILDHLPLLFAIGVGVGMSDDNDGTAALASLVSWLIITSLLAPSAVVAGIIRPSKISVQVIIGTKVQFVADEMKKML